MNALKINRQGCIITMTEAEIEEHIENMVDDYDGDDVDLLVCIIYAMKSRIDKQDVVIKTTKDCACGAKPQTPFERALCKVLCDKKMLAVCQALAEFDYLNRTNDNGN